MKILKQQLLAALALLSLAALDFQRSQAFAQGTAFAYQGQLANNGLPASGSYDLTFALFNAGSGAGQLGGTLTNSAVTVSNGLFTVALDFGGQFPGADRWLEIGVRTNGGGAFTTLTPRQKLAPTPYAMYSANAGSAAIAMTAGSATSATTAVNATTATTAGSFTGSLGGDVTGTQGTTVVAKVGGQTAANVASGVSVANTAASVNSAGTIVKRDGSGNFAAGAITATSISGDGAGLTSLNPASLSAGTAGINISGNAATATSANSATTAGSALTAGTAASATMAATANNFSGSLSGDVTGTQGATAVASVGGQTAANVAGGASAANSATSANTPNTLVKRDGSGNISAGGVTAASFAGNGSALTSLNGANLLSGSVSSNQLASGAAVANLLASGQSGVASGGLILSTNPASVQLVNAGYVQVGRTATSDSWLQKAAAAGLTPRELSAAVWTGSKMIIWGGYGSSSNVVFGDGSVYDPSSDTWTAINTSGAPSPRADASVVWTGTEMLVWGGDYYNGSDHALNDGARYNPQSDTWTPISTNNAPFPRWRNATIWTGTEMLVWGGQNGQPSPLFYNDGARYNPANDTWTTISVSGAPSPRQWPAAVWSGTEMLIWTGGNGSSNPSDGSRYDPISNSWTAITSIGAPIGREKPLAVWTGTGMIVWGGNIGGTYRSDGAQYNPALNSWIAVTTTGAPSARTYGTAIWTGREMIVWGGHGPSDGGTDLSDGASYNPTSLTWSSSANDGVPTGRNNFSSVWTGSEMLVWGGRGGSSYLNDTFSYKPGQLLYLYLRQ